MSVELVMKTNRSLSSYLFRNRLVRKMIIRLKFDPSRARIIKKYLKETAEPKLQLGFGLNYLDGWFNTGISLQELLYGTYLDAGQPFPFPDASVNYVFSEHLFEHLTYQQGLNMLKECYRILKPGGVIRIATPDLRFLLGLYQDPEKPLHKDYIAFTTRNGGLPATPVYAVNRFHTAWGHKIIYDKETLTEFLEQVGFKDVCVCEVGKSNHPDLTGLEGHLRIIPAEFNQLETMVLEATK